MLLTHSNTTNVKVKWYNFSGRCCSSIIQIQPMLRLNKIRRRNKRRQRAHSNTTNVKVKLLR